MAVAPVCLLSLNVNFLFSTLVWFLHEFWFCVVVKVEESSEQISTAQIE